MQEESRDTAQFQLGVLSGQISSVISQNAAMQSSFASHVKTDEENFKEVRAKINKFLGAMMVVSFLASMLGPYIVSKFLT